MRNPKEPELLKAPQFGNLEESPFHVPGIVQEYLDLAVALQPGDGINRPLGILDPSLTVSSPARPIMGTM